MKNAKFELFGRTQRQFHRSHPWNLSPGGLYVEHSYADTNPGDLSWMDETGFVLNHRRVIVSWRHPRLVYSTTIADLSQKEAGDAPATNWLRDHFTASHKPVGKSRKKIVEYVLRDFPEEAERYFDKCQDIYKRLMAEGIELDVSPFWKRERMMHGDWITLVVPMEVRNKIELALVAKLARRLMLGQTTLEAEFPGYQYGRADWLRELHLYPY